MKKYKIFSVMLSIGFLGTLVFLCMRNKVQNRVVDHEMNSIVCVGDSITYGAGVRLHREKQSYPAILDYITGGRYEITNYGISGTTLLREGNFPYVNSSYYQASIEAHADIYIIMLGTNDSKTMNWNQIQYKEELFAFVRSYQLENESSRIILMQPPKAFPVKGKIKHGINDDIIGNEIHRIIANVGVELGCDVIDLYALTEHHPEWYADGVHPNKEGNKAIAKCIAEQIKEF